LYASATPDEQAAANPARDSFTVTSNSRLISGVSRKRADEYTIDMGSFIGGGGSRHATAEVLSK
jgi:hypothetical protein